MPVPGVAGNEKTVWGKAASKETAFPNISTD